MNIKRTRTKKLYLGVLIIPLLLDASGIRVPEQSLNMAGVSNAYLANAKGADTAYANPANMSFNDEESSLEISATYINIPKINFTSSQSPVLNASSQEGHIPLATFHYVSQDINNYRFGLSLVAPYGLSIKHADPLAKASAKLFEVEVVELNPTISYKIDEKFSIGGGVRLVYGTGKFQTDSSSLNNINPTVLSSSLNMEVDAVDYGYNLAITYKLNSTLSFSARYRSKVNLKLKGDAQLTTNGTQIYNGSSSITLPIPAELAVGIGYNFTDQTSLEFVYERIYWSSLDKWDFNYDTYMGAFDDPIAKNWKDSDIYSLGISHKVTSSFTLMLGYSRDYSPIPDESFGFELPSADANIYALGCEYSFDEKRSFGISYNNIAKESKLSTNPNALGEFDKFNIHTLTFAYKLNF